MNQQQIEKIKKIEVRPEDIAAAVATTKKLNKNISYCCPVAQALRRITNKRWRVGFRIAVMDGDKFIQMYFDSPLYQEILKNGFQTGFKKFRPGVYSVSMVF